jgi:manganese/zinc/iron transport system permease protein
LTVPYRNFDPPSWRGLVATAFVAFCLLAFPDLSTSATENTSNPQPLPPRTRTHIDWPSGAEILEVLSLQNYNTRLVVLGTSLLGITSGLVGTFLLLRRRSLMGDALSHATLPGIGIAFIVMVAAGGTGKYLPGLLIGAAISGLAGVLLVLAIRNTTRLKDDVAMGFVLSVFFGLGVAILGMIQKMPQASAAGLESFIYGKTASMVQHDFFLIASVTALVTLLSLLLVKEFALLCFDEGFAASEGWPTVLLDVLMLALVTTVTVIGLQAVGLILIIAFLITPATAARFWTQNLKQMLLLAALIGGVSGWLGASLSALLPRLPAGAVIVLVAASIFVLSMLLAPTRGVLPRYLRQANLRRKVGRQHLLRACYEILEAHPHDPETPIANIPIPMPELASHRSWSPAHLRRLVRTARREDHLDPAPAHSLRLSESGFGEAARVTRNHRLWELYLIRHADIAPSHVDRDADMVEHILDAHIVRQLEAELDKRDLAPTVPPSPHLIPPPSTSTP